MTALSFTQSNCIDSAGLEVRNSRQTGQHGPIFGLISLLMTWQARAEYRQHLSSLDERLLKDAGITREEADAEAAKPFWKV